MDNIKSKIDFRMNRKNIKFIIREKDPNGQNSFWISRPVEERFFAIEFLRCQYMKMMEIEPVMDRKHFDIF